MDVTTSCLFSGLCGKPLLRRFAGAPARGTCSEPKQTMPNNANPALLHPRLRYTHWQASTSTFYRPLTPLPSGETSSWVVIAIHHQQSACTIILRRKTSNAACTLECSKILMQDSSRDGPRSFRGASNINASGGIVNQVGRDQHNSYQYYNNFNNAINDEMVVRQS